jgi:hypothetical protein
MQLSVFTSFFGETLNWAYFKFIFFQQLKPNNKPNFILSIRRVYKSFAHYNQPYVLSQ